MYNNYRLVYLPLWAENVRSGTFTMATEGAGSETDGSSSSSDTQRSSPDESCFYRLIESKRLKTEPLCVEVYTILAYQAFGKVYMPVLLKIRTNIRIFEHQFCFISVIMQIRNIRIFLAFYSHKVQCFPRLSQDLGYVPWDLIMAALTCTHHKSDEFGKG